MIAKTEWWLWTSVEIARDQFGPAIRWLESQGCYYWSVGDLPRHYDPLRTHCAWSIPERDATRMIMYFSDPRMAVRFKLTWV